MLGNGNLNTAQIKKLIADEVRKHLGGVYNNVLPKAIKDANGRLIKDIQQEVNQQIINLKQDITNYINKVESKVNDIQKQITTPDTQEDTGGGTNPIIGALQNNLIRNGAFINWTRKPNELMTGDVFNSVDELTYWNLSVPYNYWFHIAEFPIDDTRYQGSWGFGNTYLETQDLDLGMLYQDITIGELQDDTTLAFSCLSSSFQWNGNWYKNPKVVIEMYDKDDNLLTTEEITLNSNEEYWSDYYNVVGTNKFWKSNFYTFDVWKETVWLRIHIVGGGRYDALMLWSGDKPKPFELNPADRVDGIDDELEKLANAVQFAQLQVDLADLRQTAQQYMTKEEWWDFFNKDVTILQAKAFRIITDAYTIGDQTLQTQIDINALGIETLVTNSANYLYVGDNNGDYVKNADGSFSYVGWAATWTGGYEPPDSNGQGKGDYILSSGSHSRITQLSDRIVLAVDNSGKVATLALGSNTYGSIISIDADQINISGTTAFIGSDLSTCTIDGGAIEADTVIARVSLSGSALEINSTASTINHPTYGTITPKAVFGATLDPLDTDATRLTIDNLGRIWSGAVDFADAKFSVDENGNLQARDAIFFGELWLKPTGSQTYNLYYKFVSGNTSNTSDFGFYVMPDYYTTPETSPSYTRITDILVKTTGDIEATGHLSTADKVYIKDTYTGNTGWGYLYVSLGNLYFKDPAGNDHLIVQGTAASGDTDDA